MKNEMKIKNVVCHSIFNNEFLLKIKKRKLKICYQKFNEHENLSI